MKRLLLPAFILLTLLLSGTAASARRSDSGRELWRGRFRVENPGPGYRAVPDSSALAEGTNLFDLISVLPGVTIEDGGFRINGNPVAGIYINDVRIYELYGLKYISTTGITSINVTYAPNGDSSADSDGGKIKVYYDSDEKVSGILSAGAAFRPSDGFGNGMLFVSADNEGSRHTVSNVLHYAERSTSSSTGSIPSEGSPVSAFEHGPARSINDKLSAQYRFSGKDALAGSVTLLHEFSDPLKTDSDGNISEDARRYWKCGGEVIWSHTLPGKAEISAAVAGYGIDEKRGSAYSGPSPSYGSTIQVTTADIEASVTASAKLGESASIIAGGEFDALLSGYSLLSSYGDPPFDESVTSASTKGYTTRIYALVSGSAGRLRYSAGLNLQSDIISYEDGTTGRYARNNKTGINPTLKLFLPLGKDNGGNMTFVYRRSTGGIPYRSLTPYAYRTSEGSYVTGNPSLRPPVSDMLLLNFSLLSSALNLGITYRRDDGQIEYASSAAPDDPSAIVTRPVNLGPTHTASLNIGVSLTRARWVKSRIFLRGDLLREPRTFNGTAYGAFRTRAYLSMNNSFRFGRGFGLEVNARWQPSWRFCDKTWSDTYALYGSAYKTFLGNSLRLALNFTPLASGGSYRTPLLEMRDMSDRRYIGISASWKF